MNWPFEIKYPVKVSSDDWVRDANGHTIIEAHLADELNALHAEVGRLKDTQQKLAVIAAFFADTDMLFHLTRHTGVTSLREAYYDPLVQAAIKEAKIKEERDGRKND